VDKEKLLELVPSDIIPSPISVLSNGVDFEYFHPNPNIQQDPSTLVFSGKMSYHANIKMVQFLTTEIMPRIWKIRPDVKLLIVGKDPSSEIQKLASHSKITVTGEVEDIRPYLWKATVAVVPLIYGAGVQNKVLEAMAMGIPVVATSKAVAALEIVPGRDIIVADDPERFSADVVRLLENSALQSQVSTAGLEYIHKCHNWKTIAGQLADIYNQTKHKINQSKPVGTS
jgi:glycosyltransferase involved in cell wall biosynthesis